MSDLVDRIRTMWVLFNRGDDRRVALTKLAEDVGSLEVELAEARASHATLMAELASTREVTASLIEAHAEAHAAITAERDDLRERMEFYRASNKTLAATGASDARDNAALRTQLDEAVGLLRDEVNLCFREVSELADCGQCMPCRRRAFLATHDAAKGAR